MTCVLAWSNARNALDKLATNTAETNNVNKRVNRIGKKEHGTREGNSRQKKTCKLAENTLLLLLVVRDRDDEKNGLKSQ